METDLVALVEKLGLPAALVAWFLYKDYRFTQSLLTLMARIETYLGGETAS